jgi:fatty acid desaturase
MRAVALGDAIRAIPPAWFRPDPRVYWADLLASAAVGWAALALAVAARGWTRGACLIVAAFALYRAVLFIHELAHLTARGLPGFRLAWNAMVGVPLLLPSFLYEGVHTDHHRQRSYGTPADPEYVPFGRRPPMLMAVYGAGSLAVPILLALRFGVIAPLSWAVPPLRRLSTERFSALVINHGYVRHAGIDAAGRLEEAGAFAVVWGALALWWTGAAPAALFGCWLAVSAAASAVNAVRTLAAHRYAHDEGELTMGEQLLDSCTIAPAVGLASAPGDAWRALWAPVGLRFHALHHWIPALPYHNLGRAHRLLASMLSSDAPYAATQYPAMQPAIVDLVRRAAGSVRPTAAITPPVSGAPIAPPDPAPGAAPAIEPRP